MRLSSSDVTWEVSTHPQARNLRPKLVGNPLTLLAQHLVLHLRPPDLPSEPSRVRKVKESRATFVAKKAPR